MKSFFILTLIPFLAYGAPRYQGSQEEYAHKQEVSRIWNDLRNHEADLQKLQNHIATQDEAIEEMQNIIDRERQSRSPKNSDDEIAALKKHNQVLTDAINSDKDAIARLQSSVQKQEDNLVYIQKALKSIMGAIGIKNDPMPSTDKSYTVQSGDSLGEIASRHHTSIDQLKKLNQLKNDRIFVGQKIKLP